MARKNLYMRIATVPGLKLGLKADIAAALKPPGNIKKPETLAAWTRDELPVGPTPQQVRLAREGFEQRRPGYDTCHVGALHTDGMTVAEIGDKLGLTPTQVRGAIRRCAR